MAMAPITLTTSFRLIPVRISDQAGRRDGGHPGATVDIGWQHRQVLVCVSGTCATQSCPRDVEAVPVGKAGKTRGGNWNWEVMIPGLGCDASCSMYLGTDYPLGNG